MGSQTTSPSETTYTVDRSRLLKACFSFGRILQHYLDAAKVVDAQGDPVDGPRLLWAISGCESTFGKNYSPRFEAAYAPGGRYYRDSQQQKLLWRNYDRDAACSWSPWQILPCNAPGFSPLELATDLDKAATAVIGYIRRYVLGAKGAVTLEEVLDTYNSGTWRDEQSPAVEKYVERGNYYYLTEVIAEP